jgi:hypothetical protein
MENAMGGAARAGEGAARAGEWSAVQNARRAGFLKLVLLWLAVGIPMLWGVLKALQDARNLLP